MAYMTIITANAVWSCPQTGDYKVICVGKGGNGNRSGTSYSVGEGGEIKEAVLNLTADTNVSCAFSSSASTFGSYLSAATGSTFSPVISSMGMTKFAVGGTGGYTLDGIYGGAGASAVSYANESATVTAAFAPASKNGGAAGRVGFGWGAGGGCSDNGSTNGSSGVIIITRV